ncbi:hypothetical protein [Actinomadura atramentaria]|uniref:hypothetical protein n=1 Tax=Actinomadura atramentaria TaxID=1990 RepID=UPI0003798055|nr:hypothetical protein [Actinomadura atramentaria]
MPNTYGPRRFAARLDLADWQFRAARARDLLPAPDAGNDRWSAALVAECAGRADALRAELGSDPPLGGARGAARLAARVRLDVERVDVDVLAASGIIAPAGHFRGHLIYHAADLDAVPAAVLADVVAARKGPLAGTVDAEGAARVLGWRRAQFERVAESRGLTADALGRYPLDDVRALADDADLMAENRAETERVETERALRAETRHAAALRRWWDECAAYIDGAAPRPPTLADARRALGGLTTARRTLTTLRPPATE